MKIRTFLQRSENMFKKKNEDFIKNLDTVRVIQTPFVIANKTIKTARNGKNYIELNLSDKTGNITARMFPDKNTTEISDNLHLKSIYLITGSVDEFPRNSKNFSIKIDEFKKLSKDEYDLNDFARVSKKDKKELMNQIKTTINNINNPYLKKLLESFFSDKKFVYAFCNAPSAKIYHHNYLGGLLEHSVEVLKICVTVSDIFPEIDRDLLYTGAILHDVGKIKAYDYDLVSVDFTEEGKLLDHLFISCDMINEKIKELKMPKELSNKLLHIILSHHGDVQNGWGSPVNPKTPEAVALHNADNLDSKVKGMLQILS